MTSYRDRQTGKLIPFSEAHLRLPHTSFGALLTEADYNALAIDPVYESAKPDHTPPLQRIIECDPVLQGDKWYRSYEVVDNTQDMPPEQLKTLRQSMERKQKTALDAKYKTVLNAGYKFSAHHMLTEAGKPAGRDLILQTRHADDLQNLIQLNVIANNIVSGVVTAPEYLLLRTHENMTLKLPPIDYIKLFHDLCVYRSNLTMLVTKLRSRIHAVANNDKLPISEIQKITLPDRPVF